MLAVALLSLLLCAAYATLLLAYRWGWERLPALPETDTEPSTPETLVTVIVPARNEAAVIPRLLEDLLAQHYPEDRYEIIVVDDASDDETSAAVRVAGRDFVRVIRRESGDPGGIGKKAAIEAAVLQARGDLILTTDADCRMGREWLSTMVAAYTQSRAAMIVGPVTYLRNSTFLGRVQDLDFLSMVGIAGASLHLGIHNLANGANLCFEREAFLAVDGFRGNRGLPTGDDLFLLHKIGKRWPDRVRFARSASAVVYTHAASSLAEFWQQRLRWASKSTRYEDRRVTAQLVLVWLFNVSILVNALVGFLDPFYWRLALLQFSVKIVVDTLFQYTVARFFHKTHLLWSLLQIQVAHILYVAVMGPWSTLGSYRWKGSRHSRKG